MHENSTQISLSHNRCSVVDGMTNKRIKKWKAKHGVGSSNYFESTLVEVDINEIGEINSKGKGLRLLTTTEK